MRLKSSSEKGTPVIGICGGNQMLGTAIYDPHHMEGILRRVKVSVS